jgi:hypothetical protein
MNILLVLRFSLVRVARVVRVQVIGVRPDSVGEAKEMSASVPPNTIFSLLDRNRVKEIQRAEDQPLTSPV